MGLSGKMMGQPLCIARVTFGLDGMSVFDGRVAADVSATNAHRIAVVIVSVDMNDLSFMNSSRLRLTRGYGFGSYLIRAHSATRLYPNTENAPESFYSSSRGCSHVPGLVGKLVVESLTRSTGPHLESTNALNPDGVLTEPSSLSTSYLPFMHPDRYAMSSYANPVNQQ